MKTNTTEFNAKIQPYILNSINPEAYDFKAETDQEKLAFLAKTFKSEYLDHHLKYYKNTQETLRNWIMGLPSCFNIDFENYRIIEIAKEWGSLSPDADDKQEDKMLANWFNLVAFKTLQLFSKHNISL